jgi:hypothetical protein
MLQLEQEKYPPGTPANEDYRLYLCWWEDQVRAWIVVPTADLGPVADFADQFALRLETGIAVVLSRSGRAAFPIGKLRSVSSLENLHWEKILSARRGRGAAR